MDVYVDPAGADIAVPSNIDGVGVTLQETVQVEPSTCNVGDFSIMPGGVVIEEANGSSGGTSTCEVSRTVSGNKRYYMMTSAHLFTCSGSNIAGDGVNQSGRSFGTVADYDFDQDWAIVERDPNGAVSDFDNGIEDTAGIMAGHVTENGLADLKGTDTTVYKQGITTCNESGQVDQYDVSVNTSCNSISSNDYVRLTTDEDNGDSGAPHYHQYTYNGCNYLALIAPHTAGACSSSPCADSVGCAAFHINSDHNINFDPEFQFGHCK
ncbi:hypothetical protein [Haloarchaeobius sp. FL176]|uniref:hypothetical protein n=1 Tax=Haloarchaeobius sp. FL176 TaxID=2967129 RepID=UPI002148CC65|nr:hypothetical protein [Haloarchaeobius sp. FL176]